jgi:invasion protein IalB
MVKSSTLLRSTAKYALAGQVGQTEQASPVTADYHEWAVVCDSGHGVQPMLWKLNVAPGAAAPATYTIATVVSADPQYDSALLGMVGSLHPSS